MARLERKVHRLAVHRRLSTNDPSLTRLNRSHFESTAVGWLARGPLLFNTAVTLIDVSHCTGIEPVVLERHLLEILSGNRTIKRVALGDVLLSSRLVDVLWTREHGPAFRVLLNCIVADDPDLTEIVLPPRVGDCGAVALARALDLNTHVKSILIGETRISHVGSQVLLSSVERLDRAIAFTSTAAAQGNTGLQREVQAMFDRRFCAEHAVDLKRLIGGDGTEPIDSLDWSECGIGDGSASQLADALRGNATLRELRCVPTLHPDDG
jgi:hypothetical protein